MRTKEFDPDVVLGRALDAFWENGYERTSLVDLVARMGIGRRSLYDTFGDKNALFLQVLQRYAHEREAGFREIVDRAPDARQALRVLLETAVAQGVVLRRGCLTVNTATEPGAGDEACALVQRQLDSSKELVGELIERGRRDGSISSSSDGAVLTAAVFNAWLGLRVRVRAGAGVDELMADVASVLGLLD
ncbi:TetR/AcrR family transcriptional regulator [Pseudonocardia sp. CA-107938]|uniref:TetR/AcrR family transcriptional regulator n=1 Tax=Pseudonocardia sp. CA-107938 TaxID=3240021 RepID=UPI003D8A929B